MDVTSGDEDSIEKERNIKKEDTPDIWALGTASDVFEVATFDEKFLNSIVDIHFLYVLFEG